MSACEVVCGGEGDDDDDESKRSAGVQEERKDLVDNLEKLTDETEKRRDESKKALFFLQKCRKTARVAAEDSGANAESNAILLVGCHAQKLQSHSNTFGFLAFGNHFRSKVLPEPQLCTMSFTKKTQ